MHMIHAATRYTQNIYIYTGVKTLADNERFKQTENLLPINSIQQIKHKFTVFIQCTTD